MYKNAIVEIVETAITSTIVILIIYATIALPEQVKGASMEPNFYEGERILVEKITKHYKNFSSGEVIVLHPPHDQSVDYIKRIIAVPGDIVKFLDCSVYLNRDGVKYKLEESYISSQVCTDPGVRFEEGKSVKLNENEYLVLGDNRERSADSRVFGLVGKEDIVGRVVFVFWPLKKIGYIR